jgi:hypothetical protein
MKRILLPLISILALTTGIANAQGTVSLSMGQPGFYGRIDIGNYPQPPLLIPNAVMANAGVYSGPPIYLHVPPAHAHAWGRHCHLYGACDHLVYFVDNGWYNEVYVPGFRSGAFAYAPPPVYVAPPIYFPRPYYGHPHHGHHHGHAPRPHYGHGHHHHGGGHNHHNHHNHHGHHGHHGHDRR